MSADTTANGVALSEVTALLGGEHKVPVYAPDGRQIAWTEVYITGPTAEALAARMAPLLAERDALRGKVAAVEAVHREVPLYEHTDFCPDEDGHEWGDSTEGEPVCLDCPNHGTVCAECVDVDGASIPWPCATARALDAPAAAQPDARVRERVLALADDLPGLTEGLNREGTARWSERDREVYSLAIEEAQSALRAAVESFDE